MMIGTTEEMLANQPSTERNPAIDISSLSYSYPKAALETLHIPHWQVDVGEHVFLQGASGSGKSTLLQLLCGLKVGVGKLRIAGAALGQLSQAKRDQFRARHIGMVFQQFNLIPYLSAVDNVLIAANLAGFTKDAKKQAEHLLNQVGLSHAAWRQAANGLSIGQQQRVAIARALINSPDLLLLDEPTSALDEANQMLFINALMHHLECHPTTTVVFVSHDARLASYFERSINLINISTGALSKDKGSIHGEKQ